MLPGCNPWSDTHCLWYCDDPGSKFVDTPVCKLMHPGSPLVYGTSVIFDDLTVQALDRWTRSSASQRAPDETAAIPSR